MDYIIWGLIAALGAIILFSVLNHLIKLLKPVGSAQQGIWNAVYFLQLKQYKKALEILENVEAEFGMTPEVMCDFCKQKADALRGLDRMNEAADTYDIMLDALKNTDSRIKRNEELLSEIKACYASCERETDFEKWESFFENLPEWVEVDFRKAAEEDLDRIEELYSLIHDEEEAGRSTTGWKREIYPTRKTAEESLEKGDLFVETADGKIVAAAKINREQVDVYSEGNWEHDADQDQVLVLHTLVVDPNEKSKGYGSKFVQFYEDCAIERNCPYLRMDTNERNTAARALYKKLGYTEAGIVPCTFNGLEGVRLVLLEKKL